MLKDEHSAYLVNFRIRIESSRYDEARQTGVRWQESTSLMRHKALNRK